ncbi:hypothetical protein E2320_010768 [Naja naja]|nr:hypothetical protein E2320_010768 [Naja naja]
MALTPYLPPKAKALLLRSARFPSNTAAIIEPARGRASPATELLWKAFGKRDPRLGPHGLLLVQPPSCLSAKSMGCPATMEFQFNFSVDKIAENRTDTAENEKLQQEMVLLNNQENSNNITSEENKLNCYLSGTTANISDHSTLNANPDTSLSRKQSCPKSAKVHDIPKDVSKVLESKTIATLPGIHHANIYVVETALPGNSVKENTTSNISSQSDLITVLSGFLISC